MITEINLASRKGYTEMDACENKLPNINNLSLLARPVLHYSMFGVAPRNIIGESAFRKIKKEVQLRADHHCEICGRYVSHNNITKDWLHTHEVYQVDHKRRIYCFERYIGICKQCHEFIHLGYLDSLLSKGIVSKEYFTEVFQRGQRLLNIIKKHKEPNSNLNDVYLFEFEGKYFVNDFYPEVAKSLNEQGVNIIHYDGVNKVLPDELFYKPKKRKG